jgi:hypothetical protein
MCGDGTKSAPRALRELAQWVLREGIDSDHLEDYMQCLLSSNLIELHASCRYEAMVIARRFAGLGAVDVACHLRQTAFEIERRSLVSGPSIGQNLCCKSINVSSKPRGSELIPARLKKISECKLQISSVPELIAAVAFTTVGILLMSDGFGDVTLRAMAVSMCGVVVLIYAAAVIHWERRMPIRKVEANSI